MKEFQMEALRKRFQLGQMLSTRSHCIVMRAVRHMDGLPVALKIMFRGKSGSRERRDIETEVLIHRTVSSHTGVVKLLEVEDFGNAVMLVTQLCIDGTLVTAGRKSEREALCLTRQAMETVAFLHARGIAHRDLKPENVVLQDGQLKFLDFGFATWSSSVHKTFDKDWCGTLPFMPPEIRHCLPYIPSKVDVFYVGTLLHFMITGVALSDGYANAPLSEPEWERVSPTTKQLVSQLLSESASYRPSADEVLTHVNKQLLEDFSGAQPDSSLPSVDGRRGVRV